MGHLVYLSLTKPDITYVVNVISQFMHALTQDRIEVAYRVLRYLKGYPDICVLYKRHGHIKEWKSILMQTELVP